MAKDIEKNTPEEEGFGNDILTLVDEDGTEHEFEVVDSLVTDDNEYFALIPTETAENLSSDDGELVILKVVEDNGEEFLEPIEDDDEFEEISEIFMDRLEEYYDFDAGEEEYPWQRKLKAIPALPLPTKTAGTLNLSLLTPLSTAAENTACFFPPKCPPASAGTANP